MSLKKIAQELEEAFESGKESDILKHKDMAKGYLSFLKALREYYHFAHWVSKKEPFYSDHSLFQRLYEELDDEIDGSAEKFIGLMDEDVVFAPEISEMVCELLKKAEIKKGCDDKQLAICGIKLEVGFLKFSEKMYDTMKEDDSITLGLDDMIMSNFNKHEDTLYLLKQRVK